MDHLGSVVKYLLESFAHIKFIFINYLKLDESLLSVIYSNFQYVCNLSFFFFFWFLVFESGFLCVALAVLELIL